MKKSNLLLLACFPLLCFAKQDNITVVGTNDPDQDRAAIIQALADVDEGGTILLKGNFQIGKFVPGTPNPTPSQPFIHITKSKITITGDRTGGTWNTVIKGLLNTNGTIPTTDPTIPNGGILGFLQIGPIADGTLKEITIKDLKIVDMSRAIFVGPNIDVTSGACVDTQTTNGSAKNITIQDNWFEHTARAVQAFGAIKDVTLKNNIVHNNQRETFYVQGFGTSCTGGAGFFYMPMPKNVDIVENVFSNDVVTAGTSALGLRIYYADNVTVKDNTFDKGARAAPIALAGLTNSEVTNNVISGSLGNFVGQFGIEVGDNLGRDPSNVNPNSKNLEITKNSIHDIGFPGNAANVGFGIYVDINTTGVDIKNNEYAHNQSGDVLLSGVPSSIGTGGIQNPSFDNSVKEDVGTIVVDHGLNNSVK